MKDYSELEGKLIDVTLEVMDGSGTVCLGYKKEKAYVAGVDYDIGITLVFPDDHDQPIMCLNGPASPQYRRSALSPRMARYYKTMFLSLVAGIRKGFVDVKKNDRLFWSLYGKKVPTPQVQPEDCSFGA